MKTKMKILASAISLLCFSQASLAGDCDLPHVCSTVTLAGITKTFVYNTQAEADAAFSDASNGAPSQDQIDAFADPVTGALPKTKTGITTQTMVNGKPVTIIQTSKTTTVVAQPGADGKPVFTTYHAPADNSLSLDKVVNAALTNDPTVTLPAGTVQPGVTAATYATIQKISDEVAAVAVAPDSNEALQKAAATAQIANAVDNTTTFAEAPVVSTVVINGISHTYTFANQAEAQAAANSPAKYQADFKDPVTGVAPTSAIGQVVQTVTDGVTNTYVQTDNNTVVIAQLSTDPAKAAKNLVDYITVSRQAGGSLPIGTLVTGYLTGDTTVLSKVDIVQGIKDDATLATVKSGLSSLNKPTKNSSGAVVPALLGPSAYQSLTDVSVLKAETSPVPATITPLVTTNVATAAGKLNLKPTAVLDAYTSGKVTATTLGQINNGTATPDAIAVVKDTVITIINELDNTAVLAAKTNADTANAAYAQLATGDLTTAEKVKAAEDALKTYQTALADYLAKQQAYLAALTSAKKDAATIATATTDLNTALSDQTTATQNLASLETTADSIINTLQLSVDAQQITVDSKLAAYKALVPDGKTLAQAITTPAQLEAAKVALADYKVALQAKVDAQQAVITAVTTLGRTPTDAQTQALEDAKTAQDTANADVQMAALTNNTFVLVTGPSTADIAAFVNDRNQARNSPTAAIAGNPASLMGTMVDNAFNQAAPTVVTLPAKTATAASSDYASALLSGSFGGGITVQYGHYSLAGRSADVVTVPINYTARLTPKAQVIVSAPLTYARMNGSDQFQAGGGLALKYNVKDNWFLMPAVNYAYRDAGTSTGFDLASINTTNVGDYTAFKMGTPHIAGHMIAGTLTSKYTWALNPSDPNTVNVSLTNMGGYFQSMNLNTKIGGVNYQTSGSVSNYVLKNGIAFGKSINNFNVAAFFNDTEFFGDRLFFEQYDEVGLAFKPVNSGKWLDALNVSANYVFSVVKNSNIDGFKINLNYQY